MIQILHEEKKITKIIEELTIFFWGLGSNDISSNIKMIENKAVITFKSNYNKELSHKLDCIEYFLKNQKNERIEDIYWELAGSGEPGETSQLLLVGVMVDEAHITMQEDYITIELKKYMT